MAQWSFLTNHARALLCIAHDPRVRLRDIAGALGVTERSAYAIVSDLTDAGYVVKARDGRRNRYEIQHHLPLPDPTSRERTVGEVLSLLVGTKSRPRTAKRASRTTVRSTRGNRKTSAR
jgi:DNA-binding transcriptional ArsR family regulator